MPVIKVDLWKGRTEEQKAEIIKGITSVFEKQGVPKEHVTVIINDIDKSNWGMRGEQASKVMQDGK
ncbi:4-oxalocrotonate tautomerase family protein [Candidatus Woesearchaeota archaeon]|nr:4-oxalocrotonate tautomerase family protein [Candidatus Woesearchaeota archaeon]